MRAERKYVIIAALVASVAVIIMLQRGQRNRGRAMGLSEAVPGVLSRFRNIRTAITAYRDIFNEFPAGQNQAVASALYGKNPLQTNLVGRASWLDASGRLVDPWGTPIDLSVSTNGFLRMRSAGPNRIMNDKDDFAVEYSVQ